MKFNVRIDFQGEGYATRYVTVNAENEKKAKELALAEYITRLSATIVPLFSS